MDQFIAAQMQLLQGLIASVQQIQQNQQNQQYQQQQQQHTPQARDKHRDFMSHHPPAFSHAVDPLDADDWLKVIGKKLDITQCNDREKVLYASASLERAASDWWDAFTAAHANADAIT
jgi:membrane protease subunit (stomatin/prohibitin family)